MHVFLTSKNEEDPMKMYSLEWPQYFSHYKSMGFFRFVKGQLTPQPLVRSAPHSNSVQTLWLSLLTERIKKIRSKMGALERPQVFFHYNHMGAIGCHGNQSSNPILSKPLCSLSSTQMMLQIKFGLIRPAGCGDIQV